MSASSRITTGYALDVERFTLSDQARTRHFEGDAELRLGCKGALDGGSQAALVLIELGIDGYDSHRVRIEHQPVLDPDALTYQRDDVAALDAAIETLTAIRDQLAAMRSVEDAAARELRAFDLGADAGRV